jgi:PhzF family phenazine biosynthesis protein
MPVRVVQVDAFTAKPFSGNPAAICVLPGAADENWMRNVAREMNLSETAFLHPEVRDGEPGGYRLRWLTPSIEVDLCGHATLAAAHVLWTDGHVAPDSPARFYTRSGLLTCRQTDGWIEMDFPVKLAEPADPPPQLAEALGVALKHVAKNQFDYLVEVESETVLRAIAPNHHLLRQLPVRGVIVTARGQKYDFVSRFFAPGSGIDEDPVTGSAHTALAPYWGAKLGKTEMTGFQASARGGVVKVRLSGNRVLLLGQAVTVMTGEILA